MNAIFHKLARIGLIVTAVAGPASISALSGCAGDPPPAPKEEGKPVSKIGDNRFSVRKSWLAQQTSDKAWFGVEAARALTAAEDAGVKGLRVGAQPGSAFAELGLNNGDLLRSINGKVAESEADAVKLLGDLASAPNFTFELVRKGQPQTLIYEVK